MSESICDCCGNEAPEDEVNDCSMCGQVCCHLCMPIGAETCNDCEVENEEEEDEDS